MSSFVVFEDRNGRPLSHSQPIDADGASVQDVRLKIHTAGTGRMCLYDSEGRFVSEDRLWHAVSPGNVYTNTVYHHEQRGFEPDERLIVLKDGSPARERDVARAGIIALFVVLGLLAVLWLFAEVVEQYHPSFTGG